MVSNTTPVKNKDEKIMIITGEGAMGETITKELKSNLYSQVALIKNGAGSIKTMKDILPDLIILDISVSGLDSYEILKQKHEDKSLQNIPVFLISIHGIPINMQKIQGINVSEFIISLQLDTKAILEKINRHFGYAEIITDGLPVNVKQKTVMWIEDDKLIGNILGKKLASCNFHLIHVKDGEMALNVIKETIPDVIVLDLLLPGISGFDLLKQIRNDQRTKKVTVIVLSNLNKPSDLVLAKSLGIQKYLVKASVSLDQIVADIKIACNE